MLNYTSQQLLTFFSFFCWFQKPNEGVKMKDKRKYTIVSLPIIQEETLKDLLNNYSDTPYWGKFLEDTKNRLIEEDPVLEKFIDKLLKQQPPETYQSCLEVTIGVYAILACQAESEGLKEQESDGKSIIKRIYQKIWK